MVTMSKLLPLNILYSAHHASADFKEYQHRCALTRKQQIQFSDLGTRETVPKHAKYLLGTYSRGVVDLNRAPDNPTLFPTIDFGNPTGHKVWTNGMELTDEEKKKIVETIYAPYHQGILTAIQQFNQPGIVVAWDNTAPYEIGSELMRPFILSNNGDRESGDAVNQKKVLTCDPRFLEELAHELRIALKKHGLVDEVHLNTYNYPDPNNECAYIANHYNTFREGNNLNVSQPIHSFQVEYDTSITHDPETLEPYEGKMEKLKAAFEEAMERAYLNLLTWTVGVQI